MTPLDARIVQRRMRLPTRAELRRLRRGGWLPALPVGRYTDASGDGRTMWWTLALRLVDADRARNAGGAA